jgi:hypothetical protein
MISFLKKLGSGRGTKKDLLDFLQEMEKNLEIFYVTDQRQFITHGFLTDVWPRVKDQEPVRRHVEIAAYIRALQDFNGLYKDHKEFEQWYVSDLKNKTPDNARKLHGMKQQLDERLKTLEATIILAGQALEKELLQLGMLKYE